MNKISVNVSASSCLVPTCSLYSGFQLTFHHLHLFHRYHRASSIVINATYYVMHRIFNTTIFYCFFNTQIWRKMTEGFNTINCMIIQKGFTFLGTLIVILSMLMHLINFHYYYLSQQRILVGKQKPAVRLNMWI